MATPAEKLDYSTIDFISEQEREYFAEAHLGELTRDFLVSPIGRYLHGRAKQTVEECKGKFAELDPTTEEGVETWKATKQDMVHAENFMRWCAEAIVNGENANNQLQEYRANE